MTLWPRTIRRVTRVLIDVAIVGYCVALIAQVVTGGYQLELFGSVVKSKSVLPALGGLAVLVLARVLVVSGFRNFLLVATSTAATALVFEGALRVWSPPLAQPGGFLQIHRASDVYDWELIPGARGVGYQGELIAINSAGFRDVEFGVPKAEGVKRIAMLGDSFTFGLGVAMQDSYPKQLERIVRSSHPNVQTLDFGVIGYSMWQYLALLEHTVLEYDPDLIVVGIFLDDFTSSSPPYTTNSDWKGHNPFEATGAKTPRPSAFRLVNLIRNVNRMFEWKYRYRGHAYLQGIEERKRFVGPGNPDDLIYKTEIGALDDALYDQFRDAMDRLVDLTQAKGIPVIVLYIPDASQLHDEARQHVNRFLQETAQARDIVFVDATVPFEQVEDPQALYMFPLDAHTSPEGHRLIAEALARAIESGALLGSRPGH